MKRIQNFLYILYFLPIFFFIRILTVVLSLLRFKSLLGFCRRLLKIHNRVLYLEVFFPNNAGYHYRTQKWIEILNCSGFKVEARYVFESEQFSRLLANNTIAFQAIFLWHRIWHCFAAAAFNCVIVRRELLPYNDYGNLFLDKFLLALHPNVVLDFDDDISASKREPKAITLFGRVMFESPCKFQDCLGLYPRFIVGSNYLKNFVLEKKSGIDEEGIIVVPTCVDYEKYPIKAYQGQHEYIDFGWVGSTGNLKYLNIVVPALQEVAKTHKIRLIVISGREYKPNANFEIVNIPWSLDREIENICKIDIGLMPLYDTAVTRGKCGFKLIQYMGLGIVSIASAITVNNEIIDDRQNGFLVYRETDWPTVIEEVLAQRENFSTIGAAARLKIASKFSFEANKKNYLDFIKASLG